MRGTAGRELGVSTSCKQGMGNDKASLTKGMALKEAHGPRALGPGRELGVSTSWGHGTGNDKASSLTEGMALKEAHGPRALGPEEVSTSWEAPPRPPQREEAGVSANWSKQWSGSR
jgi:hypothetical protein